MVSAMLEDVSLQSPSTTQRWRQLYLLLTMDIPDIKQLLRLAADMIYMSSCAASCTIIIDERDSAPLKITVGTATADATAIDDALQCFPTITGTLDPILMLPLKADDTTLGVIQLVAPASDIQHAELELIADMLAQALVRQAVTKHSQRSAQRIWDQYQVVQGAVTSILAELTARGDATQVVLQSFCENLDWDLGVYWSVDQQVNGLRCHTLWDGSSKKNAYPSTKWQTTVFTADEGLPGSIWANGQPRWVVDLTAEENIGQEFAESVQSYRSGFFFPIWSGAETHGVIGLLCRETRLPDQALIDMLTVFGCQVGQAAEAQSTERALRVREQKYRMVVDRVREVIFETDASGHWTFLNPAWTEITGFGVDESLGTSFWSFIHPEDRQHNAALLIPLLKGKTRNCHYETRYLTRDGDAHWVEVHVWLTVDAEGKTTGTAGMLNDVTERKETEMVNAQLTQALRVERDRLLRREIEVRTQIGRDLHDGPVQQVAVADLSVQYVRRMAECEPERLGEALDDLRAQLQRATRDLRTVLYELRPLGIAEEGLVMVLHQYVARIHDVNGLCIHLNASDNLPRIAPDYEAAVFIIVQEAINNVRKHAQARNIWITLSANAVDLFAEVRDDGCGFPIEQIQANYIQRGSFGLLNMAERAQLLNGSCVVTSAPGAGTTVTVRVPLIVSRQDKAFGTNVL